MEYTEGDLAYAAGIVDGEGAIQIQKHRRSDYNAGYHYYMNVQVGMNDPEVPLWLKPTFGGSLHISPAKGKRKQCYCWTITTNKAAAFLELILPYLKIKQAQAEIAIEFQTMKHSIWGKYHRVNPKPLALLETEAILAQKLRGYHHKGRKASITLS